MENIETFVNFCESYGVTRTGLFQTVDLFDGRNMTQVISCIQQLGSEVHVASQPHHFSRLLLFYLFILAACQSDNHPIAWCCHLVNLFQSGFYPRLRIRGRGVSKNREVSHT